MNRPPLNPLPIHSREADIRHALAYAEIDALVGVILPLLDRIDVVATGNVPRGTCQTSMKTSLASAFSSIRQVKDHAAIESAAVHERLKGKRKT